MLNECEWFHGNRQNRNNVYNVLIIPLNRKSCAFVSLSPRLTQGPRASETTVSMQIRDGDTGWWPEPEPVHKGLWFAFGSHGDNFQGDKRSAASFPFAPLNPLPVLHHPACVPRCWPLWLTSSRPPHRLASKWVWPVGSTSTRLENRGASWCDSLLSLCLAAVTQWLTSPAYDHRPCQGGPKAWSQPARGNNPFRSWAAMAFHCYQQWPSFLVPLNPAYPQ